LLLLSLSLSLSDEKNIVEFFLLWKNFAVEEEQAKRPRFFVQQPADNF
jgi:hypothetical protein